MRPRIRRLLVAPAAAVVVHDGAGVRLLGINPPPTGSAAMAAVGSKLLLFGGMVGYEENVPNLLPFDNIEVDSSLLAVLETEPDFEKYGYGFRFDTMAAGKKLL